MLTYFFPISVVILAAEQINGWDAILMMTDLSNEENQ